MKKRATLQIEGGLGKQIAMTALLPSMKKEYEEVVVMSSYPEVFDNNPNVYRNISHNTPYGYEEYFKTSDDIFFPCGYRDNQFRSKKISLIQAACNSINWCWDELMKPEIFLTQQEEKVIQQIHKDFGSYIIIQSHGGMSPAAFINNQKPSTTNVMAKDLDIDKAEEFVELFHKEYPNIQILNYTIPGETPIKNTISLDLNTRIWMGLMKYCLTFLSIDSSLQHMSAAFNKIGVVLWGATSPITFGYNHNINMENKKCCLNNYHCQRPYFVPSSDIKGNGIGWECPNKICMDFNMKEVYSEIKSIITGVKETLTTATIDLDKFLAK